MPDELQKTLVNRHLPPRDPKPSAKKPVDPLGQEKALREAQVLKYMMIQPGEPIPEEGAGPNNPLPLLYELAKRQGRLQELQSMVDKHTELNDPMEYVTDPTKDRLR